VKIAFSSAIKLFASGVALGVAAQTAVAVTAGGTACGMPQLAICPQPLDKTLPDVKNMLTWNQTERVVGFRNDYRSYPGDVFKHGAAFPLPYVQRDLSKASYVFNKKKYLLTDYLKRNDVAGMLVLKDGKIAYEYYGAGNNKTTLWTSRSVGKSVVSTLVGIALQERKISSLDDKLVKYNPALRGTAWELVTLRQLIQHTSGVEWSENYEDPTSDFSRLTQCEAGKKAYACVRSLIINAQRKSYAKPGEAWSYSSGGAWVLGDTLERATGMPLARYLQQKIWQPFGMANDGVWHSYELGHHDVGAHGFNATLQDWGRFGLFVLRNGQLADGQKTLPDNWVKDASTWTKAKGSVTAAYPNGTYGYQWWNNSVPVNALDVAPKQGLDEKNTLWALGSVVMKFEAKE